MSPGPNLPGGGSYGANLSKRKDASNRQQDPEREKWGGAIVATILVGLGWYAAWSKDFEIDNGLKIALGIGSVVVLALWERAMNSRPSSSSSSTSDEAAPQQRSSGGGGGCLLLIVAAVIGGLWLYRTGRLDDLMDDKGSTGTGRSGTTSRAQRYEIYDVLNGHTWVAEARKFRSEMSFMRDGRYREEIVNDRINLEVGANRCVLEGHWKVTGKKRVAMSLTKIVSGKPSLAYSEWPVEGTINIGRVSSSGGVIELANGTTLRRID